MSQRRVELQRMLEGMLGSRNVYFCGAIIFPGTLGIEQEKIIEVK